MDSRDLLLAAVGPVLPSAHLCSVGLGSNRYLTRGFPFLSQRLGADVEEAARAGQDDDHNHRLDNIEIQQQYSDVMALGRGRLGQ